MTTPATPAKTTAGLDRQTDDEIRAWVATQDLDLGNSALHRAFREAGFGANAKRFGRLADEVRVAAVEPEPKPKRGRARKAATA